MAVSSLSPTFHTFLSPLRTTTTTTTTTYSNSLSSISLSSNLDFASSPSTHRRPAIIVCSSSDTKVNGDLSSEEKRVLLERYGFSSDDIISETSSKRRTKREIEKKAGKGNRAPREGPKPPRTTHKLLQVLGGTARRMKLLSPKGMDVRPMMEVVKGAAFDILQVAGGSPAFLRPGRWLDLYSGTGSVGIEALSRGCSEVHFVEMDPWVVSEVLKPNLEWTGFMDNSVIHTIRVESFLERAEQFAGQNGPFDYISVTPPYTAVDYSVLMNQIAQSPLIGENTFIVVEYALKTDMLDTCGSLVQVADRRFGRTHLAIYGPQWAQKKRKPKKSIRTIEERALLQAESTH